MNNNTVSYDLEERTRTMAISIRKFVEKLTKTISNIEDSKQLIRSSASVAANYIEANEALSKKDFVYRVKVCRKEEKESLLFLELINTYNNEMLEKEKGSLNQELTELMKIFGAIVSRSK